MKRYINLLPPEEQREIALAGTLAQVSRFGAWFLLSLVLMAATLYGARFYLQKQLTAAAGDFASRSADLRALQTSALRGEVETFNMDLKNFIALESGQETWSDVLEEFGRLIPSGLTLDRLAVDPATARVEAAGRAGNRASVLQLRQNILGSERFQNVNFPLKNLEKARDANWSYRFYVKQ